MPKKPQMTLRSGKALANAAPVLPQSRSDRRSQTLMLDDEEEEPLVRKRLRRSYQQTSSSSVSDHHGNNDDRQKELSLPAATLPSASTASQSTIVVQTSTSDSAPSLVTDLGEYTDRSHCRSNWAVEDTRTETGREGRPEINALVDWVLIPGNYESLRVENAKKAGRTVNDVYGDVARYVRERVGWTKTGDEGNYDAATARKDVDYIKKKFSATYSRVFNMTGNGTTDDTATVPQRVHQECPNFYEMLSIFRTPSLSKPINTTTAHSTGPTAIAKAGEAEIIDTELSDDEPIRLTQNLISVMGSLTQVLGSLSGNGTGASSSGRDYFINRIEQLERKLEQQNEHITQQKDIICGLQIKLARAGIPF
ncbi:hypothetical protein BGZ91_008165 [Linnemannia elongata]|nr:hypothetical protein BGZ91_008165 [Linnemannia elongata]